MVKHGSVAVSGCLRGLQSTDSAVARRSLSIDRQIVKVKFVYGKSYCFGISRHRDASWSDMQLLLDVDGLADR